MDHRKENLKEIEASINMLQDKAIRINNKIKEHNNLSNKDKEFIVKKNKASTEIIGSSNKSVSVEKLEIEILKLKKKQDILTVTLYIITLVLIFSLLAVYELRII
tara:strand:- start:223 stop:537 length:315 start_codon:yes stop_codon:yes gene_type:complete